MHLLDGDPERGQILTLIEGGTMLGFQERLDTSLNEHYLWHGSSPEAVDAIAEDGFMISKAGSNAGTMFGRGAYFAECSSKADEYSVSDSDDLFALLLCRVVCGQLFRILKSNIPKIEAALESGDYDAVLGDREAAVKTYREFVVFRELQVYPEYTIKYKRIYADDSDDD